MFQRMSASCKSQDTAADLYPVAVEDHRVRGSEREDVAAMLHIMFTNAIFSDRAGIRKLFGIYFRGHFETTSHTFFDVFFLPIVKKRVTLIVLERFIG